MTAIAQHTSYPLSSDQLKACQQQNAELAGKEQRAAEALIDWQSRCNAKAQLADELNGRCADLEQRLAEADAMQSLAAAVDEDDDDDDDDNVAAVLLDDQRTLASIAVQTESTAAAVESPPAAELPNGGTAVTSATHLTEAAFQLSDFGDDIALLIDPAVRREEELITFKEECERLREQAQQNADRLAVAEKRLAQIGGGGGSRSGGGSSLQSPSLLVYVALAIAVIGYIIVSPYW